MPEPVQLTIPPPVAGINLATSVDKLQPTQAVNLRGFEYDEYGTIGTPRPPKSIGPLPAAPLSAHKYQRASGATQLLVHFADGTLRFSTDFLTTAGTATWTTIASGLSTTAPFRFLTWVSLVWMTNGVDDYRSWNGAASTTYPTVPKGKFLAMWKDTLWMAGDTPDRVRSSVAGDGTTWPALNFIDIGKGEGDDITSIFSAEASLIVFKAEKTHIIYDPIEYTNRAIDLNKGCIAHSSVVSHGGYVYFASALGICQFLGDGPSEVVSQNISPLFDDLFNFGTGLAVPVREFAEEDFIWGYSFENFVGWYIPNNRFSQYVKYFPDLPDKPWLFGTPNDDTSLTGRACVISVREPANFQQLYKLAGTNFFREYGGGTADSITCEWSSAWFNFDTPMLEKLLDMMQVLARGTYSVSIKRDYDDDETFVVATNVSSGENELQELPHYLDIYGRCFQIVFTSTVAGERRQPVGTGLAGVAYITRFQTAFAAVTLTARVLSHMYR